MMATATDADPKEVEVLTAAIPRMKRDGETGALAGRSGSQQPFAKLLADADLKLHIERLRKVEGKPDWYGRVLKQTAGSTEYKHCLGIVMTDPTDGEGGTFKARVAHARAHLSLPLPCSAWRHGQHVSPATGCRVSAHSRSFNVSRLVIR